jgi:hypothetical protein
VQARPGIFLTIDRRVVGRLPRCTGTSQGTTRWASWRPIDRSDALIPACAHIEPEMQLIFPFVHLSHSYQQGSTSKCHASFALSPSSASFNFPFTSSKFCPVVVASREEETSDEDKQSAPAGSGMTTLTDTDALRRLSRRQHPLLWRSEAAVLGPNKRFAGDDDVDAFAKGEDLPAAAAAVRRRKRPRSGDEPVCGARHRPIKEHTRPSRFARQTRRARRPVLTMVRKEPSDERGHVRGQCLRGKAEVFLRHIAFQPVVMLICLLSKFENRLIRWS